MARPKSIAGYAPAMIDVDIQSTLTPQAYIAALNEMGMKPGDWSEVTNFATVNDAALRLRGVSIVQMILEQGNNVELGASVAGSLAAFNPLFAGDCTLNLILGEQQAETVPLEGFLLDRLQIHGIKVAKIRGSGSPDVCLVSYHKAVPERTMMLHRGISLAEGIRIDQQKETIVFISAFEIRRDFFRLDDLSLEREGSKIALSLGDKSIYAEQLKQTVYKLLKDNHLAYVLGDIEEYRRCFLNNTDRTLGVDITEVIQQCSREHQTTFLVTAGANGIYGVSDGVICFLPPNRVVGLVNTNGAGDAAAGAFVSTHLATGDLMQSLEYSIREAEAVLRSVHGIKAGGNV